MEIYIRERCIEVAKYIIATKCTVREAGKKFGYSWSTVHKDIVYRLPGIDERLAKCVAKVLKSNKKDAPYRGGLAAKNKREKF